MTSALMHLISLYPSILVVALTFYLPPRGEVALDNQWWWASSLRWESSDAVRTCRELQAHSLPGASIQFKANLIAYTRLDGICDHTRTDWSGRTGRTWQTMPD